MYTFVRFYIKINLIFNFVLSNKLFEWNNGQFPYV